MMPGSAIPSRLREQVRISMSPARPLAASWMRALALAPLGVLALVGIPAYFGHRPDLPADAAVLAGLSAVQLLIGWCVLAAALREAVPGQSLSKQALAALSALACGAYAAIVFFTANASLTHVPAGRESLYLRVCLGTPVVLGLPLLALTAVVLCRAFPLRPAIAGGLAGLGIGLFVDSGWRLFCEVTDPAHVLMAHGGSVLALAIAGAFSGWLWSRSSSWT